MAAIMEQSDRSFAAGQCVIRVVGADAAADLEKVAKLHMELLDYGPMAGLGERFIHDVCYAAQLEDDLLKVALYEVDGEPAGFVAYTAWSITFHRQALKRHWLRACWVLTVSLLRNPRRLGGLVRALRVIVSRRAEQKQGSDPSGEVVAVAVRPEYSSAKFSRRSGHKVSEELVIHAAAYLQRCGVTDMRMLVDADNKAPLFLYHNLGASFEDYQQAGEPMVQVRFDLDANPVAQVDTLPGAWRNADCRGGNGDDGAAIQVHDIGQLKLRRAEARDYVARLLSLCKLDARIRVLVVGYSAGYVAEFLSDKVASVAMWDSSPASRTRALLLTAGRTNIEYVDLSRANNAQGPEAFDLIVGHSIVQCLSEPEIVQWMRQTAQLLRPNGSIVISDIPAPVTRAGREALQLVGFCIRHGLFWTALGGGVRDYLREWRSRGARPLTRADGGMLRAMANQAGLGLQVARSNLSYRRNRLSVVLERTSR